MKREHVFRLVETFERRLRGLLGADSEADHGLSDRQLSELPVLTFSEHRSACAGETTEECPICFSSFDQADLLRKLDCGHPFHQPCIDHWLKYRSTCPVCKLKAYAARQ